MNCPKCGSENREKAKFCNECGLALIVKDQTLPNAPVYEAERKRVTALFQIYQDIQP